jgi:hypothetical protein
MSYLKGIAALVVAASLLVGAVPTPARADVDVSFGFFYDSLTPHGSWYVSAQYGRVWQPTVYARDWNPYYDGHWEYTDLGWTWVSDYHWGTIPYHYGTWVLDARYGWVWVPGYTWAPAWVVFRTGPDYYGWAPVPVGYSVGASIHLDPSFFVFVSAHDFLAPRVRVAVLPPSQTRVVIQKTKIVNNITIQNNVVVNRGPDIQVVERTTGRRIERKPIERVARVAPFERVSKDRLRIAPDRAGKKPRAAEPMPADRPLPEKRERADNRQKQSQSRSPQTPPPRSQPEKKQRSDDDRRDDGRSQEQLRTDSRSRQQASENERQQKAAQDRARAQAQAESKAKAQNDAKARQQPSTASKQTEKQQSAAQERARAQAQERQRAEANAKAQAEAKAKAQAEAKRKAQAKKKDTKKPEPEKKDRDDDQSKS